MLIFENKTKSIAAGQLKKKKKKTHQQNTTTTHKHPKTITHTSPMLLLPTTYSRLQRDKIQFLQNLDLIGRQNTGNTSTVHAYFKQIS